MTFEQLDSNVGNTPAKQETSSLAEEALHLQLTKGGGGFGHCGDDGCGWERERRHEREEQERLERERQHQHKPVHHRQHK